MSVRKYLGKGINAVGSTNKGIRKAAAAPINLAADATVATTKLVNKAMPIAKKTDPSIANLWTGYREGRGAITAAAAIGGGYVAYSSFRQTEMAPKTGEISYGGTAPIMNADGVSSTSQAPTLGAGGNMVFGLHSARKG